MTQELDQVVVIGYGVQKKSDLTGAIASVDADEIAKLPATNVMHAIQGKAAGVEIVQNSGAPVPVLQFVFEVWVRSIIPILCMWLTEYLWIISIICLRMI
ncbi:MAG: hypothetical protein V8R52_00980 [Coprobacter fastidiosus]